MVGTPDRDAVFSLTSEDGSIVQGYDAPAIGDDDCRALYRALLQARLVEEKLERSVGEEAAHVGSAYALRATDWIHPPHREIGAALWRGDPVSELDAQARTHTGTEISQATGIAMAAKISKKDDVVLVFFDETLTSTGEFHVALNFAGVWKAPVIFVCRGRTDPAQTSSDSFAVKGLAYGVTSVRVDGADLLTMISAVGDAATRARNGEGPTLIEAVSTTDPLDRWRAYLARRGLWSQALHDEHASAIRRELSSIREPAEPALETLFDDVYAERTPQLVEQQAQLLHLSAKR